MVLGLLLYFCSALFKIKLTFLVLFMCCIGQLSELRKANLARVICSNGDGIHTIQPHVMELPFRESYPTLE